MKHINYNQENNIYVILLPYKYYFMQEHRVKCNEINAVKHKNQSNAFFGTIATIHGTLSYCFGFF